MDESTQNPLETSPPSQPKISEIETKTSKPSSSKKEKKSAPNGDATNAAEPGKEKEKVKKSKDDMTIDDLLLPRTLISRLARGSLPPNTSLQKDALLALTKSATVFISYLAHTANSLTARKTIQADDILKAINEMELDGVMRDRLEKEIQLFEEGVRGKRKGYRDRVKARDSGVSQVDGNELDEGTGEHVHKRVKRSVADGDMEMDGVAGSSHTEASTSVARHGNQDDDDEDDDPSAQLLAEASRATERDDDATESDAEVADEDDEDDDDDDEGIVENEDDDDEDEENQEAKDGDRRIARPILAPDGRAEVDGSEDDSD